MARRSLVIGALFLFCQRAACFSPPPCGSAASFLCRGAAAGGMFAGKAMGKGGRETRAHIITFPRCSYGGGGCDDTRRAFLRTLAIASLLVLPTKEGKAATTATTATAAVTAGATEAEAQGTGGAWRKYTALAPLGAADATVGGAKRAGMSLDELAGVLARDVERGATGKGGYFISGDLSPEVITPRRLCSTNFTYRVARMLAA